MDRPILLSREHDRMRLRAAFAAGDLDRVRRGAYRAPLGARGPAADRMRALDRVRAVDRQLRSRHVFSHGTAALLHGAPLWRLPDRVHVLVRSAPSGRSAPDIARRRGLPEHAVTARGLPATTLVRTVVDCALTLPPLDALVVADWAIASGMSPEDALRELARPRRRNGTARARWVLEHADGGAESPWETWVRYLALRAGLPRPRTQAPVGRYRCDLGWPDLGVLVEFDGRVKYTDGAFGAGYDADRARFDDKVREDAITALAGVRPLRFTARDGADPLRATARLLAAFPLRVRQGARVDQRLPLP
ncbi:hypothetical protein [Isoptericola aurantiacus]|uniref:hypothetical protein n=1 Tax=Isoptericola aurantiacus TaxID=3377839 RepID=UPI00383A244D